MDKNLHSTGMHHFAIFLGVPLIIAWLFFFKSYIRAFIGVAFRKMSREKPGSG